jgi:HEAT repeat protein
MRWIDDLKTGSLSSRLDAIAGLSHTPGADCIRALIGALDNSQVSVREAAFEALESRGATAVPLLAGALANKNDGIVWRSALLLGGLNAGNASGPLIGLLDRVGRIQLCAIWALGEIRSREATTPLLKFIHHADPAIRKEAVTALEKIGGE